MVGRNVAATTKEMMCKKGNGVEGCEPALRWLQRFEFTVRKTIYKCGTICIAGDAPCANSCAKCAFLLSMVEK